jgi:hypothetical protein
MKKVPTLGEYLALLAVLVKEGKPITRMTPIALWPFPSRDKGD